MPIGYGATSDASSVMAKPSLRIVRLTWDAGYFTPGGVDVSSSTNAVTVIEGADNVLFQNPNVVFIGHTNSALIAATNGIGFFRAYNEMIN
jgi:hypothetical protein